MDAVSRVDDAVALAAYVQALVQRYVADGRGRRRRARCHPVLTHENKWQAARYGLEATVVDPSHGGPVPVAELIERTLTDVAPHARELGCEGELDGVRRLLRDGNGAKRQLAVYAATQDAVAVTRDIVELTRP